MNYDHVIFSFNDIPFFNSFADDKKGKKKKKFLKKETKSKRALVQRYTFEVFLKMFMCNQLGEALYKICVNYLALTSSNSL